MFALRYIFDWFALSKLRRCRTPRLILVMPDPKQLDSWIATYWKAFPCGTYGTWEFHAQQVRAVHHGRGCSVLQAVSSILVPGGPQSWWYICKLSTAHAFRGAVPSSPLILKSDIPLEGYQWRMFGCRRCHPVQSPLPPFAMSSVSALPQQYPLLSSVVHHEASYFAPQELASCGEVDRPRRGAYDLCGEIHPVGHEHLPTGFLCGCW